MVLPKYDLHCHTTASDGMLSPVELVARAADQGVEVLAITDHDSVAALHQASAAAKAANMRLLPGVELTACWGSRVVHLVGLGFDPAAPSLQRYLEGLTELRRDRAQRIAKKLIGRKLPDLLPAVLELAGDGQVGRPHFAMALVAAGVCETEQQAFKNYLGTGKVGDVQMAWPAMSVALDLLHGIGGVGILAHPTKYRLTFTRLRSLLTDFIAAGGDGVEVSYSGIKPEHQRELQKIARKMDLMVSAGSDFHQPGKPWVELGRFQPPDTECRHVLSSLL
ncbi:PHP domain-containing protein [Marinobacterium sedimentorum]|uniref:PHP domain-containing protein n=1 Tax=Marinobacterium sedimentorum TaxID=2927804 RepID=UPI0020C6D001|nr:PHP domain-containing protein [Marinobacterium sedimentorum]MCP8689738.1 PHP domain-containing protein [Marinobacterium sedimentorum]